MLTIGDKCQGTWLSHEKPFGVFCANTKPTLHSPSIVQPHSKVLLVASALKINPLWSKNDIRGGFENAVICLWIFQRTAGGFLRGEGGCFGPAPGCFCGLNPVSDWRPSSGPWVQPNWALDLYGHAKVDLSPSTQNSSSHLSLLLSAPVPRGNPPHSTPQFLSNFTESTKRVQPAGLSLPDNISLR